MPDLLSHRAPYGNLTMTRTGNFLFAGKSMGVSVLELEETRRGPTFKFQYRISWSEVLPEYDQDFEDFFEPVMIMNFVKFP